MMERKFQSMEEHYHASFGVLMTSWKTTVTGRVLNVKRAAGLMAGTVQRRRHRVCNSEVKEVESVISWQQETTGRGAEVLGQL